MKVRYALGKDLEALASRKTIWGSPCNEAVEMAKV